MVNTIEKLSNGDLKVEFDYNRNDEIKIVADSLKILKKKIKDYIELSNRSSEILLESSEELNGASDYISKSSIQISDTINNLAYDTTKQLEHSEKANKNMEILDNLIYECKEKMIIVSENSNEAVKSVSQGLKVIKDLISSTDESKVSNEEIFKAITQATDKAKNVEKVSSVISSIAAQTRLLALNATIEASKAGEFGRGFSVVADEIRTLADEAQKSSKEIENVVKELIENVEKMNEIRVNVEDNNKKQSDSINETENKYKNIYESIKNSEKSIRSYGDLVEELLNKKQEVIEDIDSLASISKNNSAKTQEINASVEEQTSSIESVEEYSQKLLELSKELKNSIDKYFKL
ncbi:MAG: methyl-accepting chemotaxis protein [Oceanotoga sp.]|uniref:methyl-accepting chemotaxis protein n=1 Tax=Oceanotoga sp. TaxID=2108366 RepID=UPI002650CE49|nr:methyl-accepting chemotaxis protein [Oceanotoga sp.]MDN5342565.1 methyl-accepting chemotaxis protein [Oceanotoga sp.]